MLPARAVDRRRRSRAAVPLALAAVCLPLLVGCSGTGGSGASASDTGFVSGDGSLTVLPPDRRADAPVLSGRTIDGGSFDLADQRGKVVVVNVWGSWCGPCREEAPKLERAAQALEQDGSDVVFVGINTRDRPEPAQAFVRRFGITFPSLNDPDGRLQLGFRESLPPAAIPSTLVIDREGRVAARVIGPLDSQSTLQALVTEVLGDRAASPDGTPAASPAPATKTPSNGAAGNGSAGSSGEGA